MEQYLAFTLKSTDILNRLTTETLIDSDIRDKNKHISNKKWIGLWDTGATNSSISKSIVNALALIPVGETTISTANGLAKTLTYSIDITLPNHVTIQGVVVSCSDLGNDIDLLIGMDIIRHGDFTITNVNNSTTFTFRVPSILEVDYVKEHQEI